MKLFPEETLLFLRMRDAKEFGEKARDSSTGRMIRDPQLKPFFEDLYGRAGELYSERAEAMLGVTWEDLQKLPQGEVAFGIVDRIGLTPAFLLLVDQGDERGAAQKLLERTLKFAEENGGEFSTEDISGVEVTVVRDNEDKDRMFGVFERENTIVVATDPDVLRGVLWHWDNAGGDGAATSDKPQRSPAVDESGEGELAEEDEAEFVPGRTLAENGDFSTILRHSRRPQDPPPQVILFVDPIGLAQGFTRGNRGAGIAVGFLPQLGLDGLLGVGATLTFATGPYDDLSHFHVLLENPRSGVLQLVTFESGDTTPEEFVPFATETYITGRWNAGVFYDRLKEMIDRLLGEGTFDRQFAEKITKEFDVDFRSEIVGNLGGRASMITAYEKPAHFRSQKHTIAVELVDPTKAAETLQKFIDKYPDEFEERQFGNVSYWAITPEWWKQMEESQRPFNAFVGMMDDHLFIGGSCQLFEEIIAARDGTIARLVDSDDFARIKATLGKETAGMTPAMFMVNRPEESMRHLYEMLTSETTLEFIKSQAEEHPAMATLAELLEEHQLPPFDTLIQYYGPAGGILYDTDTGYHAISFTLRNSAATQQ